MITTFQKPKSSVVSSHHVTPEETPPMEASHVSTSTRKMSVATVKADSSRESSPIASLRRKMRQNTNQPHFSFLYLRGHCLADETVQCCVDGPLPSSASSDIDSTVYNNPNNIYDWHDPSDDGAVIVPTIPTVDKDSVVVPTIPVINNNNENQDGGAITVPTIENPPPSSLPPNRPPGGENWHKKGWGDDIASALGLTSFDPLNEGTAYGDESGDSGISSWGGYDGALHPYYLDA